MTSRKWRWSEFRFETKFTSPDIFLYPAEQKPSSNRSILKNGKRVFYINATLSSRQETYAEALQGDDGTSDLAGWLMLLRRLHALQGLYPSPKPTTPEWLVQFEPSRKASTSLTSPGITLCKRSWDFVLSDIIRPYASSAVGDTRI